MLSVRDLALHRHIGFGTGASWRRRRASVRLPASVRKGIAACATLPCRDRERERHSSPAAPGGQRPRGYRSGVQPPMQQDPSPARFYRSWLRLHGALASLYAASPKSRISASVSVSKRSILARRWGNQDNIGDSFGIRLTASYVSCMHLQRMLSGQFPRQSTNGKQSTGALLHASRRDAVTGRGMLRKQPLEIHQDSARYAPRIVA